MGFEPTTTTLATWCSTPELLPPESLVDSSSDLAVWFVLPNRSGKYQYRDEAGDCKPIGWKIGKSPVISRIGQV